MAYNASILVVDDEEVIRSLFERYLSALGYMITTAANGVDALGKLNEGQYDMLITDIKMPAMDGIELLKTMGPKREQLVTIVITGYGSIETTKEAMRYGSFDYLTKPIDLEVVRSVVERGLKLKQLSEEKKQLKEQLDRAARLASLAQMGAGVVHEVNTVLASAKLFLEVWKEKTSLTSERKNCGLILEEIERAEEMIRRFLTFTKPSEAAYKPVNIAEVIQRTLRFLGHRFSKNNVRLFNEVYPTVPLVNADTVALEEVFLNIFTNSIDAMPHGGTITIRSQQGDTYITISCADTGIGVPADHIGKVFEPFYTTKTHGTGLGLSIAHRIIDEHKGSIKVESEVKKGTIVTLMFPLARKATSGPEVSAIDSPPGEGRIGQ